MEGGKRREGRGRGRKREVTGGGNTGLELLCYYKHQKVDI